MYLNNWLWRKQKPDAGGDGGGGQGGGQGEGGQGNGQSGQQNNGQNGGQQASTQKWPETWRNEMAGNNPDALKTLERFNSPSDVFTSYAALRQKMSSGELKPNVPFPAQGTPEEQAAWRQERGLPPAHDKYELKLKDGLKISDDDKPIIDGFLKRAHAVNTPPEVVNETVSWYYEELAAQQQAVEEQRVQNKRSTEDTLRAEWGGEYRQNMNIIEGMLDTNLPSDSPLKKNILGAIEVNADYAKFIAGLARQINPVATIVPAGGNQINAIGDELAKLEAMMGNRGSEYWKGPMAEKHQARYRDLVKARDSLQGKK